MPGYAFLSCALAFAAGSALSAQDLNLQSSSGIPGREVSLSLSLNVQPGKEILGLQWQIFYPAQSIDNLKVEALPAVKESGKQIACVDGKAGVLSCVLIGGQKFIPRGPIAVLRFRIKASAGPGPASIQIQKVTGVNKLLQIINIESVKGSVTVR